MEGEAKRRGIVLARIATDCQNRFEIVFEVWPGTPTELQIRVDVCCNLPDVQRAMQEKLEAGNLGDWCRVSVAEGCALTGQFGYQTSREDSVLTHAPAMRRGGSRPGRRPVPMDGSSSAASAPGRTQPGASLPTFT